MTEQGIHYQPPGEPRTGHRHPDSTAGPILNIDLQVRHPFDAPGIFSFLAARAIAGVETADLSRKDRLVYARTLSLPSGPGAIRLTALHQGSATWVLKGELELSSSSDQAAAVLRIRRLLDLDADSSAIDTSLARDPALAHTVLRTPGIRVPGTVDPHEVVFRAIIGQQISVKAATTHLRRLSFVGNTYTSSFPELGRIFPTARQLASSIFVPTHGTPLDPERILRLPRRSMATVASTARMLSDGELQIHAESSPEELREQLLPIAGVGAWTTAYIGMRVSGDGDAWLPKDVALVAGALQLGILHPGASKAGQHRELEHYARRFAPWRSYAAMHLWQAAGPKP